MTINKSGVWLFFWAVQTCLQPRNALHHTTCYNSELIVDAPLCSGGNLAPKHFAFAQLSKNNTCSDRIRSQRNSTVVIECCKKHADDVLVKQVCLPLEKKDLSLSLFTMVDHCSRGYRCDSDKPLGTVDIFDADTVSLEYDCISEHYEIHTTNDSMLSGKEVYLVNDKVDGSTKDVMCAAFTSDCSSHIKVSIVDSVVPSGMCSLSFRNETTTFTNINCADFTTSHCNNVLFTSYNHYVLILVTISITNNRLQNQFLWMKVAAANGENVTIACGSTIPNNLDFCQATSSSLSTPKLSTTQGNKKYGRTTITPNPSSEIFKTTTNLVNMSSASSESSHHPTLHANISSTSWTSTASDRRSTENTTTHQYSTSNNASAVVSTDTTTTHQPSSSNSAPTVASTENITTHHPSTSNSAPAVVSTDNTTTRHPSSSNNAPAVAPTIKKPVSSEITNQTGLHYPSGLHHTACFNSELIVDAPLCHTGHFAPRYFTFAKISENNNCYARIRGQRDYKVVLECCKRHTDDVILKQVCLPLEKSDLSPPLLAMTKHCSRGFRCDSDKPLGTMEMFDADTVSLEFDCISKDEEVNMSEDHALIGKEVYLVNDQVDGATCAAFTRNCNSRIEVSIVDSVVPSGVCSLSFRNETSTLMDINCADFQIPQCNNVLFTSDNHYVFIQVRINITKDPFQNQFAWMKVTATSGEIVTVACGHSIPTSVDFCQTTPPFVTSPTTPTSVRSPSPVSLLSVTPVTKNKPTLKRTLTPTVTTPTVTISKKITLQTPRASTVITPTVTSSDRTASPAYRPSTVSTPNVTSDTIRSPTHHTHTVSMPTVIRSERTTSPTHRTSTVSKPTVTTSGRTSSPPHRTSTVSTPTVTTSERTTSSAHRTSTVSTPTVATSERTTSQAHRTSTASTPTVTTSEIKTSQTHRTSTVSTPSMTTSGRTTTPTRRTSTVSMPSVLTRKRTSPKLNTSAVTTPAVVIRGRPTSTAGRTSAVISLTAMNSEKMTSPTHHKAAHTSTTPIMSTESTTASDRQTSKTPLISTESVTTGDRSTSPTRRTSTHTASNVKTSDKPKSPTHRTSTKTESTVTNDDRPTSPKRLTSTHTASDVTTNDRPTPPTRRTSPHTVSTETTSDRPTSPTLTSTHTAPTVMTSVRAASSTRRTSTYTASTATTSDRPTSSKRHTTTYTTSAVTTSDRPTSPTRRTSTHNASTVTTSDRPASPTSRTSAHTASAVTTSDSPSSPTLTSTHIASTVTTSGRSTSPTSRTSTHTASTVTTPDRPTSPTLTSTHTASTVTTSGRATSSTRRTSTYTASTVTTSDRPTSPTSRTSAHTASAMTTSDSPSSPTLTSAHTASTVTTSDRPTSPTRRTSTHTESTVATSDRPTSPARRTSTHTASFVKPSDRPTSPTRRTSTDTASTAMSRDKPTSPTRRTSTHTASSVKTSDRPTSPATSSVVTNIISTSVSSSTLKLTTHRDVLGNSDHHVTYILEIVTCATGVVLMALMIAVTAMCIYMKKRSLRWKDHTKEQSHHSFSSGTVKSHISINSLSPFPTELYNQRPPRYSKFPGRVPKNKSKRRSIASESEGYESNTDSHHTYDSLNSSKFSRNFGKNSDVSSRSISELSDFHSLDSNSDRFARASYRNTDV